MSYRSKKHHFVPQILQRQFAADEMNTKIWYSERGKDGNFKAPILKEIKKAFVIDNFYTVFSENEPSDVVEKKFYGKIDDYLGKILPKMLSSLNAGSIPTFTGQPLESIRNAMLEMMKRTPEFTKKYDEISIGKDIIEATLSKLPSSDQNSDRQSLLADLKNPVRLRNIGRNTRVRATIRNSELVADALKDFTVRWAVSETKHSFILSSLMVYRIGNGGPNGLSNPDMEMWMPVSPKIALVLIRDFKKQVPLVTVDNPSHIRHVNENAANNCQQIASHSQKLIESLTGKNAIIF